MDGYGIQYRNCRTRPENRPPACLPAIPSPRPLTEEWRFWKSVPILDKGGHPALHRLMFQKCLLCQSFLQALPQKR